MGKLVKARVKIVTEANKLANPSHKVDMLPALSIFDLFVFSSYAGLPWELEIGKRVGKVLSQCVTVTVI
ncbi:hypothetical protein SCA6_000517 [Theobroma cacao]